MRVCAPIPATLGAMRWDRSILVLDKGRWSLSRLLPLTPPRNAGRDRWTRSFKYRLSPEEQALLLPKMEEYCQQQWGQSLEQCCQQYLSEQPQVQQNRGMIFS